jgi:DNA polymerase-3 subunit epsilon
MDFVAIDFETATSKYTSICSMGICVVENSIITDRKEIFIKPVPFEFNDYNIKIHGITPDMVYDKPTFNMYWDSIKPYLQNKTVVAHNAMFDIGALCATLDLFGIEYPTFNYLCTVKLSQLAYPELKSHKLNNLCDALGVEFSHHQAYDDAYACASVLLRIMEDYSLLSLEDIDECFEVEIGRVYPGCHLSFKKHKNKKKAV